MDMDKRKYCGHSFRIGAATTIRGIIEHIQTLTKWKSAVYLQYVRLPWEQVTGYVGVLDTL